MRNATLDRQSDRDTEPLRSRLNRLAGGTRVALRTEVALVAGVLVALELIVFWNYFTGSSTPPWDFQSHYTTEAYAWWHDGSFLNPTDWIPYLWGGYPSVVDLQNSSWYLPVGLASAVTTFDLHAAAIVSALHVALGALGVYVVARRWRLRPSAAMFGLVVWFFAAGFYSNASHLDIMRAYAWLPWVMLCASPCWPWRRWWGPVLATFVFWQAILGIYPGILIAAVYIGAVWVALHQWTSRKPVRDYLVPLAASLGLAVAMSMLRFLPAYLTRGADMSGKTDESLLTWQLLGTFLYPYDDPSLPNDITMRPFFLAAPVLAALAFVRWKEPLVRVTAGVAIAAIGLGTPGAPWSSLVSRLPGLDVSRFRMSDFKVFLLLTLCLLAVLGVDRIIASRSDIPGDLRDHDHVQRSPLTPVRVGYLVALLLVGGAIGFLGPWSAPSWISQWSLLAIGTALLCFSVTSLRAGQLRSVVGMLTFVALMSGIIWTTSVPMPWSTDRTDVEVLSFGNEVSTLISSRAAEREQSARPARADNAQGAPDGMIGNTVGNSAFYDGTLRMSGYVNLRGTPTFEAIVASLQGTDPSSDAWTFWLAPGIAITTVDGELPDAASTARCVDAEECGLVATTPVFYSPAPSFTYRIEAASASEISFNESYYPGWKITACDRTGAGTCIEVPARAGVAGQLVASSIPEGDWEVRLAYDLPGRSASWLVFVAAALSTVAWAGLLLRRTRRRPTHDI